MLDTSLAVLLDAATCPCRQCSNRKPWLVAQEGAKPPRVPKQVGGYAEECRNYECVELYYITLGMV